MRKSSGSGGHKTKTETKTKAKTEALGPQAAAVRPHLRFGRHRIPLPRSKTARIATGTGLMLGGVFAFLPVLGLWMLPAGLAVLSKDSAAIRRARRKGEVWWFRRRQERRAGC